MKILKATALSFFLGAAISITTVVGYACASQIYVQDDNDCHLYHRYVLVGSSGGGGVEVCAYEDSGGSLHREDSCDGGYILEENAY